MCGISGLLALEGDGEPGQALRRVEAMNRALAHRGPDDAGTLQRGPAALGARRLAILDPAGGAQPMANAAGTTWVVFNGEIYNHRELRAALTAAGQRLRTRSDTEVVLAAYERHGSACPAHLEGMFAFAIWDEPRRRLFLARDRVGVKPLFYNRQGDTFAFASEVKALLAAGLGAEADPDALAECFFCGYPLGPETLFRGVRALPAGHSLEVGPAGTRLRAYWDVRGVAATPTHGAAEQLHELLDESVRRALESDAPLGACLSGGLDSTLVSALAARRRPGLDTFAIGYARNSETLDARPGLMVGETVGDDYRYAALAARALGTTHHARLLVVDDLLEDIDRLIWHREKPLITLSEYGHAMLAREASRRVKVLLSGQGSDELFGGYYYWWQLRGPENTRFFPWVARTRPGRSGYPVTPADIKDVLVREDFARATRYREAHTERFEALVTRAGDGDFFNRMSYVLLKTHLQEMLDIEDRHSMAWSVEVRVPYLARALVEWTMGLPGEAKVDGRDEKALLKRAIRARVPEFPHAVLARRKSPMPPPFDVEPLVRAMRAALAERGLAIERYVERRRLDALLRALERPQPRLFTPRRYVLFSLYFLERWHRLFAVAGGV